MLHVDGTLPSQQSSGMACGCHVSSRGVECSRGKACVVVVPVVEEGGSDEGTSWSSGGARRGRGIEALCGLWLRFSGFGGGRWRRSQYSKAPAEVVFSGELCGGAAMVVNGVLS
ncbi:hypothetical protein LXL04_011693 [Taraxacum kok-saghyz]